MEVSSVGSCLAPRSQNSLRAEQNMQRADALRFVTRQIPSLS